MNIVIETVRYVTALVLTLWVAWMGAVAIAVAANVLVRLYKKIYTAIAATGRKRQ